MIHNTQPVNLSQSIIQPTSLCGKKNALLQSFIVRILILHHSFIHSFISSSIIHHQHFLYFHLDTQQTLLFQLKSLNKFSLTYIISIVSKHTTTKPHCSAFFFLTARGTFCDNVQDFPIQIETTKDATVVTPLRIMAIVLSQQEARPTRRLTHTRAHSQRHSHNNPIISTSVDIETAPPPRQTKGTMTWTM